MMLRVLVNTFVLIYHTRECESSQNGAKDSTETSVAFSRYNWPGYIGPAPKVLALMASVTMITATQDFQVEQKHRNHSLLKNPESFSATMAQVLQESWSAFNLAQVNMDQISMYMEGIIANTEAIPYIVRLEETEMTQAIPRVLGSLISLSWKSSQSANATKDMFIHVLKLMQQVVEATTQSKGDYEAQQRKQLDALNMAQAKLELSREREKALVQEIKRLKKSYDGALEMYITVLSKIPSDMEVFFTSAFDEIKKGAAWLRRKLSFSTEEESGGGQPGTQGVDGNAMYLNGIILGFHKVVRNVSNSLRYKFSDNYTASLNTTLDDFKTLEKGANSSKISIQGISDGSVALEKFSAAVNTAHWLSDLAVKYIAIKAYETEDGGSYLENKTLKTLSTLRKKLDELQTMKLGSSRRSSGSHRDDMRKMAKEQAEMLDHYVDMTLEQYDKIYETEKEMEELTGQIAAANFEKLEFEAILKLMRSAMEMYAKIAKQWSMLVSFFSATATEAEVKLSAAMDSLQDTLDLSDGGSERIKTALNDTLKLLETDMNIVYDVSSFLYNVSTAYVMISKKYVMKLLAGIEMIREMNETSRQATVDKLRKNADAASVEIGKLKNTEIAKLKAKVKEEKRLFELQVNNSASVPDDCDAGHIDYEECAADSLPS